MKITVNHEELAQIEALLPESIQTLIPVLGYAVTLRLIETMGGTTLTRKTGERRERTGGAHILLVDVLDAEQLRQLNGIIGGGSFYIPQCDSAFRTLRNIRFLDALAEQQRYGRSLRQSIAVLCPQFGICDRQAWKLIKKHRHQPAVSVQPGLFGD